MFFGVFGMDSSVAQIYQLFDELKANPEYKEQIHEQLKKVVRRYSSTLFTDYENYFNNVNREVQSSAIAQELKDKFSRTIENLISEYKDGKTPLKYFINIEEIKDEEFKRFVEEHQDDTLKDLITNHNLENGQGFKSFIRKKNLKELVESFAMSYLCDGKVNSASLSDEELKTFLNIYRDFNKRTQVSQIPKMVNRTPGFDINQDSHITEIINMYYRSYKEFKRFDACTIEWDLAFQQALTSDKQIDLSEALISYQYLKGTGKKIRALSMVYPNACPDFDENITQDEFLEKFESYLYQLFTTCPDVDYLDFFNELAYEEGMHGTPRTPNENGIVLETGKSHPNPSIFERLFGQTYYIDLLKSARKVMEDIEKETGKKITTKLMYNDFGHENGEKSKNILRILKDIRTYEREHNKHLLDGVGVQCRLTSEVPTTSERRNENDKFTASPSLENIETFIEMARGLDPTVPLEVQITEMDCIKTTRKEIDKQTTIHIDESTAQHEQQRVYQEVFDIGTRQMDKGNISGFTLGDFNNSTSFQNSQINAERRCFGSPDSTAFDKSGKSQDWAKPMLDTMSQNITHHNEQMQYASTGLQVPSDK